MSATAEIRSTTQWERIDAERFQRTKTKEGVTTTTLYQIGRLLGEGGFSQVPALVPVEGFTGKEYALKVCRPVKEVAGGYQPVICPSLVPCKFFKGASEGPCSVEKEYTTLTQLPRGAGLPKAPKAFFPHDKERSLPASMILRRYDFSFSLEKKEAEPLSLSELLDASIQLFSGLETLHAERITHNDFCLLGGGGNILYDTEKKQAVISDFGMASLPDPELERQFGAEAPIEGMREDIFGLQGILNGHYHERFKESYYSEKGFFQAFTYYGKVREAIRAAFKNEGIPDILNGLRQAKEICDSLPPPPPRRALS